MKRWLRRSIVVLVVAAAATAGIWWYTHRDSAKPVLRTATVQRSNFVVTIGATGTIEPEEAVDVGAQVAGQIISFGKDADGKTVNFRSYVKKDMVLAEIDPAVYQADNDQAQAQLDQANSGLTMAQAQLKQLDAKRQQAKADWDRAQLLGPSSEALAKASFDAYKYAYLTAEANYSVGEAAIEQAKAAVKQADAMLKRTKRNLAYCTITSPVDGVVISRRVNIGQTVVSSLNAPSLFLIAKDLKRMQVWVAVNEADIGKIYIHQPVTFTTDSVPNMTFVGEVTNKRYDATMTSNVVTYTVEVTTDNSRELLMPYSTANVQFEVSRHPDALIVPNAALRWTPQPEQTTSEGRDVLAKLSERQSRAGSSASRQTTRDTTRPSSRAPASRKDDPPGTDSRPVETLHPGVLWVPEGELVRPVHVRVGPSDGLNTLIDSKDVQEGMMVVTGQAAAGSDTGGTSNPFAPQFPRRGGGGGGKAGSK